MPQNGVISHVVLEWFMNSSLVETSGMDQRAISSDLGRLEKQLGEVSTSTKQRF
jgi:hypothetical protein